MVMKIMQECIDNFLNKYKVFVFLKIVDYNEEEGIGMWVEIDFLYWNEQGGN